MSAIRAEPPRWLWLYVPPTVLILEQAAFIRDYTWFDTIYTEAGLVEILTAVAVAAGVITGIEILRHRTRLPTKALRIWVVLVTLGCFYALGEEINWGQLIFHWTTPEWLASITDNCDGTSASCLSVGVEEAPRLSVWLFGVSGILHVLLRRGASWFWPSRVCFPAALLAVVTRAPSFVQEWFGMQLSSFLYWSGWEEMEELFLAWFLFLYLLSIWYRLTEAQGQAGHD